MPGQLDAGSPEGGDQRVPRPLAEVAQDVAEGRVSAEELHEAFLAATVYCEAGDIDDSLARPLERLTRLDAVRLAVAVEPAMLARGFSGWLGTLRRNRRLLHLQPEGRSEVEQLGGVKARFRPAQSFPPGRGVFIADRRWNIVQVARPGSLGQ